MRSMIRANIADIEAFDTVEKDQPDNSLGWIDSGVEIFRRAKPATPPRHLVSYFVLVDHINA